MRRERVLLIGHSGFVGPYLKERLAKKSDLEVVLYRGRVQDFASLSAAFSKIDVVVNLASPVGSADWERQLDANVLGVIHLCKLCKKHNVKLVHASTANVNFTRPGPYAKTKIVGEAIIQISGVRSTVIQFSTIFGPGDHSYSKVARLSRILHFAPVIGNGKAMASPIYVGDAARLIEAAISARPLGVIAGHGEHTISTNKFVSAISGKRPALHIPPKMLPFFSKELIDSAIQDKLSRAPSAWRLLKLKPTPLEEAIKCYET